MLSSYLFYCVAWICFVSVLWFYTDMVYHYAQLLGLFKKTQLKYAAFVAQENRYLPDFLYELALHTKSRILKFIAKLLSCPYCTTFWLSLACVCWFQVWLDLAVIYLFSIVIIIVIKRLSGN